ncbi:MAG: sigma 54-interacting transcriptional regulator, partial [Planctomycetota bacterium]
MAFMTASERRQVEIFARLANTNPFLGDWVELERAVLGDAAVEQGDVWSLQAGQAYERQNIVEMGRRMTALAEKLRERLEKGVRPSEKDLATYEEMVSFMLYERLSPAMLDLTRDSLEGKLKGRRLDFYDEFEREGRKYLSAGGIEPRTLAELPHLFACSFQVRRAFYHIFEKIVGASMPTARLRAAVWQSVFTHDMRRYRRGVYGRMGELTTLITGPSGSGKELVARAIAMSRYIPFDAKTRSFSEDVAGAFYPLDLSAMSPTLIEGELFGHKKGAFTGALADRAGPLELCPRLGSVFLDEIGELSPAVQAKLLRVLETRRFRRLGDSARREFRGKIMAATNRDLAAEMEAGRFREDLYYRLCSDTVRTPGLAERLADSPGELDNLVLHLSEQVAGGEEAPRLAEEVLGVIRTCLGPGYAWPGNIRELAQCVRNVLVRRDYCPPAAPARARAG